VVGRGGAQTGRVVGGDDMVEQLRGRTQLGVSCLVMSGEDEGNWSPLKQVLEVDWLVPQLCRDEGRWLQLSDVPQL
jgi:hypothetical protein